MLCFTGPHTMMRGAGRTRSTPDGKQRLLKLEDLNKFSGDKVLLYHTRKTKQSNNN